MNKRTTDISDIRENFNPQTIFIYFVHGVHGVSSFEKIIQPNKHSSISITSMRFDYSLYVHAFTSSCYVLNKISIYMYEIGDLNLAKTSRAEIASGAVTLPYNCMYEYLFILCYTRIFILPSVIYSLIYYSCCNNSVIIAAAEYVVAGASFYFVCCLTVADKLSLI